MHKTTSWWAVSGTILALGTGAACAADDDPGALPDSSEVAEKPGGGERRFEESIDPEVLRTMRAQEALRPAVQRLHQVIDEGQYPGAMTVAFDDRGGVELWWKGELPAPVRAAVADAEKLAPVRVHAARYSRVELNEQADRVGEVMRAHPEYGIQSVEVLGDGSGLRIGVKASQTDGTLDKIGKPAFAPGLPALDVPVTTVFDTPFSLAACAGSCGRHDDQSPWYGGVTIMNRGIRCTAGFGVRNKNTGGQYLITAAHCATPPDGIRDQAGEYIGPSSREVWRHDILLVSALALPRIWDGSPTTTFSKHVTGWGWATPGELVCLSGSTSGIICNLRTSRDWSRQVCDTDSDGDYGCYNDLITTEEANGRIGVREGDSGGPVFVLDGNGVQARGTVSGGNRPRMLYQDFATAVRDFGDIDILRY